MIFICTVSLAFVWCCFQEPSSGQKLTPMSYISLADAELANRLLFRLFGCLPKPHIHTEHHETNADMRKDKERLACLI